MLHFRQQIKSQKQRKRLKKLIISIDYFIIILSLCEFFFRFIFYILNAGLFIRLFIATFFST